MPFFSSLTGLSVDSESDFGSFTDLTIARGLRTNVFVLSEFGEQSPHDFGPESLHEDTVY